MNRNMKPALMLLALVLGVAFMQPREPARADNAANDAAISWAIATVAGYHNFCEPVPGTLAAAKALIGLTSEAQRIAAGRKLLRTYDDQGPRLWCSLVKPQVAEIQVNLARLGQ